MATQLTGLLDALYGFLPAEVAEPSGMPLSHAVLRVMARQEVGVGVLEMVEDALAHLLLEAPGKAANMKTRGKDPQSWTFLSGKLTGTAANVQASLTSTTTGEARHGRSKCRQQLLTLECASEVGQLL